MGYRHGTLYTLLYKGFGIISDEKNEFSMEENPGIKNGYYKRNLRTKYGELKQLSVPRNRDNSFHSA